MSMKLILLSDLHQLGRRGDIVETKTGYAANYLIPKGLAVQATTAAASWFESQRKKIESKSAHEQDEAAILAARLDGKVFTIAKRVGGTATLYGSVTVAEVHAALEEGGFTVDKRMIDVPANIKSLGEHDARVILHPAVIAAIKISVVAEE